MNRAVLFVIGHLSNCLFVRIREVVGGGAGGPNNLGFWPYNYLVNDKSPIYCLPLQYQFSDYLPDSDKWTIGQLDNWTNVQLQKEPLKYPFMSGRCVVRAISLHLVWGKSVTMTPLGGGVDI